MEGLRFALLFNGSSLEHWHLRCLNHLEKSATLVGIISTGDNPNSSTKGASSTLMGLFARSTASNMRVDVRAKFTNIKKLSAAGHEPIAQWNLDFILSLGLNSVPMNFGRATRHGVWCFQHETEEDLLPFFREVYDGEHATEAALLALAGPSGVAAILEQGCFRTEKLSYVKSRDRILESIAEWPARACRRLARKPGDSSLLRSAERREKRNGPPQFLRFCGRIIRRNVEAARQRVFLHSQWNIGVIPVPVGTLLRSEKYSEENIEWFPRTDPKGMVADPFGLMREGTLHVLCEYFPYRTKGDIRTFDYSPTGFTTQPELAIELPVHMSYPFLLEEAGEIYCIPETCAAREIALFRAVEFPRKWSKVGVLLEQFAGVDPIVFRHGGRWWLMCTEKGRDEDLNLWVWHASDLLGPWKPHDLNPVKSDVRNARPGGMPFVHEGVLYRPAQDCSKTYGWRIAIQRVKTLTPSEFDEEPVTILEASANSPFPLGRHTLTPVGGVVLIDGNRALLVWHGQWSFVKVWARRMWGKIRGRQAVGIRSSKS
jgi:hypothetical protein